VSRADLGYGSKATEGTQLHHSLGTIQFALTVRENDSILKLTWNFRRTRANMTEFDRKVEEASARFNRSVANIAETLEKETADLVNYLNDEVVPAVRGHSSKALRTAAGKLSKFADFLETQRKHS
jgi:hypothetical protein